MAISRHKPILIVLCAALVFMALLAVRPSVTYACSCVVPAAPLEAMEQNAAVFSGKVISIQKQTGILQSSADPVKVTFAVAASWKGVEDDTVTLTTALGSESCGFEFKEGEDYLVYARAAQDTGELTTSLCSRTTVLASAGEDLSALGPGEVPAPMAEPPKAENSVPPRNADIPDDGGTSAPYILAGLVLVVIAIGASALYLNRKKGRRK